MVPGSNVSAGQAVYTPLTLLFYDLVVLGVSNHLLWRCPTRHLRAHYQRHIGARHLDIGVGTGYFLDKADWPDLPRITLMDLNPHSLAAAAKRIHRYGPAVKIANCLEPFPLEPGFDSIGFSYLLHCVPGRLPSKAAVFDNAARVLAPGGVVFGSTILQGDAPRSGPAQALMDFYNRKGIFSNAGDTRADLAHALESRFEEVELRMEGAVALFAARAPRHP
ncbi:MAG: class I SAM-dependent methyltransferase [Pseudomonadota bacterium]